MLGKTEIPQILTIGAVSVRKTCSVYADFAERFPADQLAGKQRLRKANHVFSRGKQPGVTAEIAPVVAEQQGFRVVRQAARRRGAQNLPLSLDAMLVIIADASTAKRLRHGGEGFWHAGRRKNPGLNRVEQAETRLGLDDIFDDHRVHIGINADGRRWADGYAEKPLEPFFTGRRRIDAPRRLQTDAEA